MTDIDLVIIGLTAIDLVIIGLTASVLALSTSIFLFCINRFDADSHKEVKKFAAYIALFFTGAALLSVSTHYLIKLGSVS